MMDESRRIPPFVSLWYDVYGNEYHCYLRSKINISDKYLKHKPMNKYRVITDNLDWCGVKRGTIVVIEDWAKASSCIDPLHINQCHLYNAFLKHSEWFEEIKEEEQQPRQFNLKDMIEFGRFVYDQVKPSTIPIDMILLDKWIQKAYPEDCVTKKE